MGKVNTLKMQILSLEQRQAILSAIFYFKSEFCDEDFHPEIIDRKE